MAPPPPPPSSPLPSPQQVQQFLSTALSQRGPSALPYAEDTKLHIRNHLVSLVESYPSLTPKAATFTYNDGRSLLLLKADGTIPILFRGQPYNIPAAIWLLEHYPRLPPSVYLTPTPNMTIKPNHPFVDRSSGCVHSPYLRSWIYPSSNLLDLVRSLSQIFSLDPPLFARPSPNPNPNPNPSATPTPQPYPRPNPNPTPSPRAWTPPMEDPAEVYRRNAISKILESVHADTAAARSAQEAEMEGMFATQGELRRREQEISRGMREMLEEKEALEQQLQLVLMNADVLESWVRENEGRRKRGDFDVDDVFEPADVWSRQLMECTAADMAAEDTVYSLDKAVQDGAVPFDMYLKGVRALSREQFFHRALGTKVKAAQVQSQVASMAARAPAVRYGS